MGASGRGLRRVPGADRAGVRRAPLSALPAARAGGRRRRHGARAAQQTARAARSHDRRRARAGGRGAAGGGGADPLPPRRLSHDHRGGFGLPHGRRHRGVPAPSPPARRGARGPDRPGAGPMALQAAHLLRAGRRRRAVGARDLGGARSRRGADALAHRAGLVPARLARARCSAVRRDRGDGDRGPRPHGPAHGHPHLLQPDLGLLHPPLRADPRLVGGHPPQPRSGRRAAALPGRRRLRVPAGPAHPAAGPGRVPGAGVTRAA